MAKQFKKSKQKPTPPWMTTMGDMNNLLMCFFIVLMGEDVVRTQQEDIQLLLSAFKGNVGVMEGGRSTSKGRLSELGHNMMSLPSSQRATQFARGHEKVLEILRPEIQAKMVRISEDERGLVITLASDAYFDPGSAMLKDEIKPVLKKIANIVSKIPNFVRVEGHTDNRAAGPPGAKTGYETNWELSGSRSINVLRYMTEEEKVNPKQMSAVAFGQQRPIDDNNTPEGRAFNRRVDVVILRGKMFEEGKDKRIPRPLPDEEWR
ncbi:MAG: OmpA family protein [Spirochaetes bacterium]|nr:OmpA family protein [Spirochaetota bacterium]